MDPSNSFESQAFVNANQPEQIETITCMDHDSYNAAAKGEIEFFECITDHQSLDLLLTPNKNTVLHIYITALDSKPKSTFLNPGSESTTNFVEGTLQMCPSLLWQANAKGETPLHIAARYGHTTIAEVLIKLCAQTLHQHFEDGIEPVKEMLRMTNKEKDTALHEAVRYDHLKVVELLLKEDPDFSYSANDIGETPLYIAAERGFEGVLFEILDKCKSPMYGGPLGRTALHAAVIRSDIRRGDNYLPILHTQLIWWVFYSFWLTRDAASRMSRRILEKIEGISRKVDNNGWTPLHLAAYFGHPRLATLLLDKDRKVAYMKDIMGRTALHIAAQCGNCSTMERIVLSCPDCCELVDNRGWNVLHFAIKGHLHPKRLEFIVGNLCFNNLLNEKNVEGDTPLHCYSNSMQLAKNFVRHPQVDTMAFNKENLSAYDMALSTHPRSQIVKILKFWRGERPPLRVIPYKDDATELEGEDQRSILREAAQAHLVVAALIATVTFAACVTMPGGFAGGGEGSHPGSALLRRNAAFKAFIITDTIAMMLSSFAVLIHLWIPNFFRKEYESYDHRVNQRILSLTFFLILGAMLAMGLAFVTGTYAVLEPSLGLAIANCVVGLTIFVFLFLVIM